MTSSGTKKHRAGVPLGFHRLIEFEGCSPDLIANAGFVRRALLEATRAAGGTIVTDVFHEFSPFGLSGVIVISESHVAIHTWPEYGCVSVDVFSCTRTLDAALIEARLADAFAAAQVSSTEFERGRVATIDKALLAARGSPDRDA